MEKTRIHIFKMAILVKNVGTYKKHNEDDCVTKVLQLWAYFNAWIKKWGVEK